MARTKALTISRPYDARHVAGVNIPGAATVATTNMITIPVENNASTNTSPPTRSMTIEPDEIPTHMNMASNPPPKRSNTIASSFNRPSLRLKSSLSLLRGRGRSKSPESVALEKKEESRERERSISPEEHTSYPTPPAPPAPPAQIQPQPQFQPRKQAPPRPVRPQPQVSLFPSSPQVERKVLPAPTSVPAAPLAPSLAPAHAPKPSTSSSTRPKRADSGTAIDFNDIPVETRPLGFKEIARVSSWEERMKLYERTRQFWATADHGLEEWVGRTTTSGSRQREIVTVV